MKNEVAAGLEKAERILRSAYRTYEIDEYAITVSQCYLAAEHAAKAFIFEQTGRVVKKHGQVISSFGMIVKDEEPGQRLGHAINKLYDRRMISNYGAFETITVQDASEALRIAAAMLRFVSERVGFSLGRSADSAELWSALSSF